MIAALAGLVNEWNQGASWMNRMMQTDNYAIAFSALLIVVTMLVSDGTFVF